ncbi:hypothetical protein [Nostoc sp. TCL240-02]|uniref:hypothetical protein n=1 Tax=Nostoc sp. TCL240-02 TaxID=2572090 RepID=UPI00157F980D|nr:hypothetical protein [Nostoc sp. TCL240-02]QKQ75673.1 hypothetical protein FBB35_22365 [Nostoc sp. TCL240-02]
MSKRIINLGGGNYNQNIQGDYIQGEKQPSSNEAQTIDVDVIKAEVESIKPANQEVNTGGANYTDDVDVIKAEVESIKPANQEVNTGGANYTERVDGKIFRGDVYGNTR